VLCLPFLGMAWFSLAACPFSLEMPPPSPLTVSTFAGNPPCNDDPDSQQSGQHLGGFADGPGHTAQFNKPTGIAIDKAGNLYVTDSGNFRIRKITPEGEVSTFAGDGAEAQFESLNGIAIDAEGNLYVADASIRKITPEGVVSTFADIAAKDITIDSVGNLYVTVSHRIRKISPEREVTDVAGNNWFGLNNDSGDAALFDNPRGIALGTNGNLYVADVGNKRIRKVTLGGVVSTFAGKATFPWDDRLDGVGTEARFVSLGQITMGADGNFYLTDGDHIRKATMKAEVTTVAGSARTGSGCGASYRDGLAYQAIFNSPGGMAAAPNGDIYVADTNNHRIRKLTWE